MSHTNIVEKVQQMSDISKKLTDFLEKENMSIPVFAKHTKINPQVLYNTRKGITTPRQSTQNEIEKYIDLYYSLLGEEVNKIKIEEDTLENNEVNLKSILEKHKSQIASELNIDKSDIEINIKY